MKMKKIVALFLSAAMVASMAVGCGSKDDGKKDASSDGKTVLKFAAFEGGNGTEIWEKIADAFEKSHENVEVELEMSSELDKDLTKDFQNGDIPDVVYYNLGQPSGFTETMLKENAIADLSDVFDEELTSKLVGGITENSAAQPYGDGKVYLAPITYTPTGFWYNKDLFGEGKYTLPTTGYFDTTMYQMLAQAGGMDFYNKAVQYDKNTWTSAEGKEVVDTIAKLASPEYLWSDTVANANADGGFKLNQQAVIDGQALFMPNGNWVIGEMADSTPEGFNWAMMAQPKFSADQENYVYTYTEQMWVPAEAPNLDLAKEFIEFMYSDEVVDLMLANETTDKETGEKTATPIVPPVLGASDKLPEGPVKDSYTLVSQDGYNAVSGVWATTEAINGFDMSKTVYGAIDALNTGDLTADAYQKQLVDAWATCLEHLK